ncbi:hypothetical protein SAMN04488118_11096 [Epibacterium ulvae]|uniref:TIGR03862 family flavoprotein n=1 Tax=Epibacterium ulvae TaxID=1156985 RepID=A0A1G5R8I6_9RHOB|nr:TIGR03862 family flavoprotein [Epibacterium ulvae]SCZ70306.1 hypothetical protein SAMN04488118_11096 [Epibacterium ulvae]
MAENWDVIVVGAGPAGLMAADILSASGLSVLVAEAKPSVARKFLMAGKSGLNLTKDEPLEAFLPHYGSARSWLDPMLQAFGPVEAQAWATGLGRQVFSGSTGRVFPTEMKASPLLRAWLARLEAQGVRVSTRWRWTGWEGEGLLFQTPDGFQKKTARATILALGGASWARLGSDGVWAETLATANISLAPFKPANAGLSITWSGHIHRHLGTPLKGIALCAGHLTSRGEAVLSERGLEGGGIYSVSAAIRDGAALTIDLLPDLTVDQIVQRLQRSQGKTSFSNHMRKTLKLSPAALAVLQEFARPLPQAPFDLAVLLKSVTVLHEGLRPMDEAISTAGGVHAAAFDSGLMLRDRAGVFCAGEMLDWEAPTGGYLLTACLATGRWAGVAALRYLSC